MRWLFGDSRDDDAKAALGQQLGERARLPACRRNRAGELPRATRWHRRPCRGISVERRQGSFLDDAAYRSRRTAGSRRRLRSGAAIRKPVRRSIPQARRVVSRVDHPRASAILLGLVANTGQRFLAAEHNHHVEYRRRYDAAGQGGAQGLGDLAEFQPGLLGERLSRQPPGRPRSSRPPPAAAASLASRARASASSSLAALSSSARGRSAIR